MWHALKRILIWLSWPHEVLHYLAARALGLPAYIKDAHTVFETAEHDWQMLVITLFPAICSLGLFVASLLGWGAFAHTTRQHLAWSCVAWVTFWYTASGVNDIQESLYFLRHGRWPDHTFQDEADDGQL